MATSNAMDVRIKLSQKALEKLNHQRTDLEDHHDWMDSFFDRLSRSASTTVPNEFLKTPGRKPASHLSVTGSRANIFGAIGDNRGALSPLTNRIQSPPPHQTKEQEEIPLIAFSPFAAPKPTPAPVQQKVVQPLISFEEEEEQVAVVVERKTELEVSMEISVEVNGVDAQEDEEEEETANLSRIGEEEVEDEVAPEVDVDMEDESVVSAPAVAAAAVVEQPIAAPILAPVAKVPAPLPAPVEVVDSPKAPQKTVQSPVIPATAASIRSPPAAVQSPQRVLRSSPVRATAPMPVSSAPLAAPTPIMSGAAQLPPPVLSPTLSLKSLGEPFSPFGPSLTAEVAPALPPVSSQRPALLANSSFTTVAPTPPKLAMPTPGPSTITHKEEISVPLNDAPSTLRQTLTGSASKPPARLHFVGLPKKSLPFQFRPSLASKTPTAGDSSILVPDSQQSQGSTASEAATFFGNNSTTTSTSATTAASAAGGSRQSTAFDDASRDRRAALAHKLQSMGVRPSGRTSTAPTGNVVATATTPHHFASTATTPFGRASSIAQSSASAFSGATTTPYSFAVGPIPSFTASAVTHTSSIPTPKSPRPTPAPLSTTATRSPPPLPLPTSMSMMLNSHNQRPPLSPTPLMSPPAVSRFASAINNNQRPLSPTPMSPPATSRFAPASAAGGPGSLSRLPSVRDAVRNFETKSTQSPAPAPTPTTSIVTVAGVTLSSPAVAPELVVAAPVAVDVEVQQPQRQQREATPVRALPNSVAVEVSTTPRDAPPPPPAGQARVEIEEEEEREADDGSDTEEAPEEEGQVEEAQEEEDSDEEDERADIRAVGDMLGLGEESLRFGDEEEDDEGRHSADDEFDGEEEDEYEEDTHLVSLPPPVEDEEEDDVIVVEKEAILQSVPRAADPNPLSKTVRPSSSMAASNSTAAALATKPGMPGAFGAASNDNESDDEGDVEMHDSNGKSLSKQSSKSSLASSTQGSSQQAGGVLGMFKLGGGPGAKKTEPKAVKSIQLAAAAAKKEKEEKERRAAAKEEREQKRLAILQKRQDEERAKLDEEKRAADRKRKEREDLASSQTSKAPAPPKSRIAGPKVSRVHERPIDDEPAKKRKVEPAPVLKKPPTIPRPFSTASSSQNPNASMSSSVGRAPSTSQLTKSASGNPHKMASASGMSSFKASTGSSMVGYKHMTLPGVSGLPARIAPTISQPVSKPLAPLASSSRHRVPSPSPEPEAALPDIDSEYSDSGDEAHNMKVAAYPHWANSPAGDLARQALTNPDEVFGPMPPLKMREIFRNHDGSERYGKRSSSARWEGVDALTETEKTKYTRTMGYVSISQRQ